MESKWVGGGGREGGITFGIWVHKEPLQRLKDTVTVTY